MKRGLFASWNDYMYLGPNLWDCDMACANNYVQLISNIDVILDVDKKCVVWCAYFKGTWTSFFLLMGFRLCYFGSWIGLIMGIIGLVIYAGYKLEKWIYKTYPGIHKTTLRWQAEEEARQWQQAQEYQRIQKERQSKLVARTTARQIKAESVYQRLLKENGLE